MAWTCHEERPGVCRKKDDGNRVIGKEEKREAKEKIFEVMKEDRGKVRARETDIKNRTSWRTSFAVASPD